MRQLNYTGIFWTLLSVKWAMSCAAFVFAFLYCGLSSSSCQEQLGFPRRRSRMRAAFRSRADADAQSNVNFSAGLLQLVFVLVSAASPYSLQLDSSPNGNTYLRFRYGGSFGVSDPLFRVDVGFYVFHLPFYVLLQSSLTFLTILTLGIVLMAYVFFDYCAGAGVERSGRRQRTSHLSVLLLLLVANFGVGVLLGHYQLLYSTLGVVYGAGYTADHVTRSACGSWSASRRWRVRCSRSMSSAQLQSAGVGTGAYVAVWFIGLSLLPFFFQNLLCSRASWRSRRLSEKLHRVHAQGLPVGCNPGNVLSGSGGPDARGNRAEPRHDPEYSSVGSRPLLQTYQQTRRYALLPVL